MFFKKNYTPIKQAINVIDYNFLVQLEPTCSLTYVRLAAFILLLALSALNYCWSVYLPCAMCWTFLSVSPLSFSFIFFFVLYINWEIRLLLFWIFVVFFFLFSVHLVSEFLVVFPASRFSISYSLRPSTRLSNPFLHPHSHLRHPFHLRARFSRNYFYPRLWCKFLLFPVAPANSPPAQLSFLLFLFSHAFCPLLVLTPHVPWRIVFYFACLCHCTGMFSCLVSLWHHWSKDLEVQK